jgi:hypothetical protein
VAAVVAVQAVWLLPALDARVAAVLAGSSPPPSPDHIWYIISEAVKLAALLAIGIGAICRRDRSHSD